MSGAVAATKAQIVKVLDRFPILRRNRVAYRIQRFRQTWAYRIDHSLAPNGRRDIIDALDRDGMFVMHDFASREACEKIIAEYEGPFQAMMNDTFDGMYQKDPRWGPFRVGEADKYSATARSVFFENEFITKVARAYVSSRATSYRREIDFKVNPGKFMQSDLPHFDDWRHRFKAFLYLTDVGPDNGPFVYYLGSHRQERWRDRYDQELEIGGMDGRCGQFFPYEWQKLMEKHGFRESIVTGKAGTLIFGDFRGVHRGQPITAGRRILLNNTFGVLLDGKFF